SWLSAHFDERASRTTAPRLVEAMRYSALNGGKRMRASLVLSAARMTEQITGRLPACSSVPAVAAAVELIHAYSLIHDDLPAMDDADLRRGVASAHIAFDEATAILAGDALQTEAFYILSEPGLCEDAALQVRLARLLSVASGDQGMAGGQMLDLVATEQPFDLEQTRQMQDMKTGALIKAAAVMGSVA
ncbi:MAG: polyprenyl synthetase family protein, partial [Pseudomonadota bacterium]|nr:polyprenyl synthetase family protein [Pseudomonadota bacterium]